jgi:signal transduction histidine kinase
MRALIRDAIATFRKQFRTVEPPRYVPAVAGIASVVMVTLAWWALDRRETEELGAQTLFAVQEEQRIIYREVDQTAAMFRRAGESERSGGGEEQERRELTSLMLDVPGLDAAVRVTKSGEAAITVPREFNVTRVLAAWKRRTREAERPDTLSFLPLDPRGVHFALTSPVCPRGVCDGAVVGVIDARALFAKILAGAQQDFLFVVVRRGEVVGSDSLRLPPSVAHRSVTLRFGDAQWQLVGFPTAETFTRLRTRLPLAIFLMGLVVSALLVLSLRLAQTAWSSARITERTRLAAALERATDAIWEWDLVTGHAERSAALWRHLGYDPAAVAPELASWTSRIHPDDLAGVERELDRHIRGDAPNFEAEYRLRDSDGRWHIIVDRGRVVDRLPGGAPARLMGISADVTEARRVDASVKELETLAVMGRVAARVAHEINNPLAGIQYSFLLIKDAIPESHPHFSYVGAIEREISRIGAVTRQLYETYRPEQDVSAHTPLATVVNDAVAFMQQVNRRTQVKIVTDLSRAPAVVSLSAAILRQVVYNLVQNAMDASPPGGTVLVTAATLGDTLEIRVSDDGDGIAPEMHDRIFEPFFSTKDTQMRTSGMGLGLALVRRSVDSAGGRISIESSPSGGALFIVTLPLDAVEVRA